MRRLIFARAKKLSFDKNFREVINNNDFSDQKIANIIINSALFTKLINNKKLSSNEIFDKLINAKFGIIARSILKELLSINKVSDQIKIYNLNEVGKNIIQYIKNNLNDNNSDLYKEINLYIYNKFHKSENTSTIKSINNITDLKNYLHNKRNIELNDLLRDIIESAVFNFICYTEDEVNVICETIKKSFIKYYPNGIISKNELSQFLRERTMSIEAFYFKYFQGNKLPIIKELIKNIYTHDDNVEIEYNDRLDNDLRIYIPSNLIHNIFINSCHNILDSKFYLDKIGVKQIINNEALKNNLPIKKVKLNNLRNMSLQQIRNLPTLPQLNRKNDNVGDQENISLVNYYQTKIIISSDGNIKYLPPNNNMQYINELTNKNLNYAIGTITDNGIVCIHKNNNMNIVDIINICKKDSQINKVYELNEQVNLAAKIIRRAKLAKLIWKK